MQRVQSLTLPILRAILRAIRLYLTTSQHHQRWLWGPKSAFANTLAAIDAEWDAFPIFISLEILLAFILSLLLFRRIRGEASHAHIRLTLTVI